MTCDEVQRALSAFLDGEATPARRDVIARHVEQCAGCRGVYAEIADISLMVQAAPQPALPDGLATAVRSALASRWREQRSRTMKRVAIIGAPLLSAAAAAALTALMLHGPGSGGGDPLADVVAAHVRSLLDDDAVQIASGDPHQVRPWFAGRLDFAPAAPDLAAEGYPLLGARLDYLGERIVAAVVYRRRLHMINVFVWPSEATGAAPVPALSSLRRGYHVTVWQAAGLAYAAISDLNAAELAAFAALHQSRAAKQPAAAP